MKSNKKLLLLAALFFSCSLWTTKSNAQIALNFHDTTICPGQTIQMCAALTGHSSTLNTDDNFTDVLNIGFTFDFYGQPYTQLVVSGNGMVCFATNWAKQFAGWMWSQISTSGQANNSIFATFVDLFLPAGGVIKYEHFGSPGHRKFVVDWCHIPLYGCHSLWVTSQLILFEGSNKIEIHTTHISPITPYCPSASGFAYYQQVVQGVRNASGTSSNYTPDRGPIPSTTNWGVTGIDNDARLFTPNPGTPFTYNIDTIPFDPFIIVDSLQSSNLKWYDPNQPNTPIAVGPCATVTPDGSQNYYTVHYNGPGGCDNNNVNVIDTVFIHYGSVYDTINASICDGQEYYFLGRHLTQSGQYDTLFQKPEGCDSTIVLNLTVNPNPTIDLQTPDLLDFCDGDSTRILVANPDPSNAYQWYKDGSPIPGGTQTSLVVKQSGSYTIKATSSKGCTGGAGPVTVNVYPVPPVKITPPTNGIICTYDTIGLSVEDPGGWLYYTWSPTKPFLYAYGVKGPNVRAVFQHNTEVKVTAYNRNGCHSSDSVFVQTKACCALFVPNAFTPNDDGLNDYFKPKLLPGQILVSLKIFNRLGQLVYNNDDIKKGWNGLAPDGEAAPADTYMYSLQYTCADGKLYKKKGSVSLVR